MFLERIDGIDIHICGYWKYGNVIRRYRRNTKESNIFYSYCTELKHLDKIAGPHSSIGRAPDS